MPAREECEVVIVDSKLLERETKRLNSMADSYVDVAKLARVVLDPSAAWVCELNAAELREIANELDGFAISLKFREEDKEDGQNV